MKTSQEWVIHFNENLQKQRIDWEISPTIKPEELQKIRYGLRAWQKGETSDGNNLKTAALRYAQKTNDLQYFKAICLFIKEEQKHGANLGRYIDLIGDQRLNFDWGDHLFRKIRGLNRSMEIWTLTVIVVELAAQIFYQALKHASECVLLKAICTDILIDEAHHIQFQQERLAQMNQSRGFLRKSLLQSIYYSFGFTVSRVIWITHSKAFEAGGVSRQEFLNRMDRKLHKVFSFASMPRTRIPITHQSF